MRRARQAALAVLVGMPGAMVAHAAEYDLGEIVVTARKPVVEQAGIVRELDDVAIRASGARSLDEAIDLLPGVNVRVGGQGTPRIDVRGFRTRHVKLLINGIPFNSAADGQFDPTLIPTDWISRIKLTSGASSQLYGDGGLGGVINVITRRGEGEPAAEIGVEGGEYGHLRTNASFAWGSDRADAFVTLGRRTRDAFGLSADFEAAPFETGGARQNSDLERNSVYGSASYRPNEVLELGVTVQYQEGEHGIPTGIFDNNVDRFAQRPRFDRVEDEDGFFVQVNALYRPHARWNNHAWIYHSVGTTNLTRYADDRYVPLQDASIRNTFEDESRVRVTGAHDQFELTHPWGGTVSFMVDARQERLDDECVIQDIPLTVPLRSVTPAATPAPAAVPTSLVLEYDYTTTNNHGATNAAGQRVPIARLTASNRPGGGVDFSITNLATDNFGGGSFLQSIMLSPIAGFDPTGLSFTQAAGSQGEIGNVNFFTTLANADGYLYPILVNFRRPGAGDPLLAGESAGFIFNKGTVTDYFGAPADEAGALGPDMFSAIRIRGTDAAGFWGASGVDVTGGGPLNRVFVQASSVLDPAALPAPPAPAPILVPDTEVAGALLLERVCGGGAGGGDGTGGGDGDGTGGNRVERLAGFTFGKRLLVQERAVEVLSAAVEVAAEPLPRLGLVAGVGHHWQSNDRGDIASDLGYNLGATYRLGQGMRLKATHARKIRPPGIAQLYDPVSGNEDLAFEQADLVEVGFRHAVRLDTNYELTLFRHDVAGLVQRDVVTGFFRNIAETRFKGLELTATTTVIPRLRLDTSYTHLSSRDESPGTERKQQQYTPENTFTLSATYSPRERLDFYFAVQRVADQFYYSRGSPLARDALDDYTLVDMNWRYTLPGARASVYLGIDNVFDTDYAESYGLPQFGRFVYAGFTFKLL
ncbi:MAG: TonB-dependent receptor [Gammaproteobacteria bacterium]